MQLKPVDFILHTKEDFCLHSYCVHFTLYSTPVPILQNFQF
jgi:hypothetical protein